MSEPFLGEIRIFSGNFAPTGWALCQGQTLPIAQNTALFAIIGTSYGGNGQTTFQLPNLQGRIPLGTGQGTGLSPRTIGQVGGAESAALTVNNLPAHAHTFAQNVSSIAANKPDPEGAIPAQVADVTESTVYHGYTKTPPTGTFPAQNTSSVGSATPVSIMPPFLAISYIIALQGIFPSRS